MSNRVAGKALRIAAIAGVLLGSTALAGCSSLGLGMGGGDVTGSISPTTTSGGQQSMPPTLKPIGNRTEVASGPFVPPADIGGGSGDGNLVTGTAPVGVVSSSALPPLTGSETMSAQPSLVSVTAPTQSATLSAPAPAAAKTLSVVPDNAYIHVIESGESLYTIARRYNVTAQSIVQANGMGSPDKIFVGQKVIIPGMTAKSAPAPTQVASIAPVEVAKTAPAPAAGKTAPAPAAMALAPPAKSTPAAEKTAAIQNPALVDPETSKAEPVPTKQAVVEPVMSGADKFRWPISGKVITDFIASKGTGINIAAPEGTSVRAAENGQVIYVAAYAHLKSVGVSKGDNVTRGDNIGQAGMTGSVSSPQLHFELRKGATPVDPVPLLAG